MKCLEIYRVHRVNKGNTAKNMCKFIIRFLMGVTRIFSRIMLARNDEDQDYRILVIN